MNASRYLHLDAYLCFMFMELHNLDSLKNKNSSGYDKIPTKIIKAGKPFIISPLINIVNKMLAQGIYPERLKFSLIKPIYKMEINPPQLTIDLFPYCPHSLKSSKKLYTKD